MLLCAQQQVAGLNIFQDSAGTVTDVVVAGPHNDTAGGRRGSELAMRNGLLHFMADALLTSGMRS